MARKTTHGFMFKELSSLNPPLHTIIHHDTDHGASFTALAVASKETVVIIGSDAILERNSSRNIVSPFFNTQADRVGVATHIAFSIASLNKMGTSRDQTLTPC
ncbi:hypothetical protein CGRA01v4_11785 [Colletotrichum graminicola]|nr:hypothetical protein CGRA01v4_11785 [Colletotrichum graminicola]